MVNVDTVYQKVLALANKEQRGYITPQDFNLFANQAQQEIFEQYFYDLNIARRSQGNDTTYADIDDLLEEKIQLLEHTDNASTISGYVGAGGGGINKQLPDYIWRMKRIMLSNQEECEILNTKDFSAAKKSGPLTRPTKSRPIANIRGNVMRCTTAKNEAVTPSNVIYIKKPEKVNWTYIVINKQALFEHKSSTSHFELHPAEENQLVNKILRLAGISNKQQDILQAGQGMDAMTTQQQPKI